MWEKYQRFERPVAFGSEGKDVSNPPRKMKLRTSLFQGIMLNKFYFAKCLLVAYLRLGCLFQGERNRSGSSLPVPGNASPQPEIGVKRLVP